MDRWRQWNDPELAMFCSLPTASPGTSSFVSIPPVTSAQRERMWERVVDRALLPFDIWAIDQRRLIGEVVLNSIVWPHATCEISVVIYDRADRGRGYGTEATRLAVAYGFDGLGLHRLWIQFQVINPAVIGAVTRWAESFGAKPFARAREAVFAFGAWRDMLMFDVLRHEFPPHPATAGLRSEAADLSQPELSPALER